MTEFNKLFNRKETHSLKWDNMQAVFQTESNDILPMWVADMDFKAPEAVNQALKERAEHGIYGYTIIDESIRSNVTEWIRSRHRWNTSTKELVFSPGVVSSLYTAIQAFTNPHDKILIQTPVYTPFFQLIKNSQRQVIENELIYEDGTYKMNLADLETQFQSGVKAMLFCSPHNPVGRVWTRAELERLAALCIQYDVLVLSDEIHADLVFKNHTHIPFASLSEEISNRTITFMSPTKTFNLAGLQASFMVVPDSNRRIILENELGKQGLGMLNTMGVIALHAAYQSGAPWLEDLLDVLEANKDYAMKRLESETNGVLTVVHPEGTYLLWIDCHRLGLSDQELQRFMIHEAKVGLNAGSSYGEAGEQFMRLNLACPPIILEEGINRIIQAVHHRS